MSRAARANSKPPGHIGRPSQLFDEPKLARILKWITAGVFPGTAARSEGVNRTMFQRWLEDARHADLKVEEGLPISEYEKRARDFRDRVDLAEAVAERGMTAEARRLARAQANATGTVQLLERRFPANWRYQSVQEITGPGGGPLQFDVLTDEELDSKLARFEEIAKERK